MNAYIVTYCTPSSVGSILQSLGLKRALSKLEINSAVLQLGDRKTYSLCAPKTVKELYHFPAKCIRHREFVSGFDKCCGFMDKYLDFERFKSYDDLSEECLSNGVFIAGSDQIWNPAIGINRLKFFFLEFCKDNKKISYAASMGKENIPQELEESYRSWLDGFDYVSVRESEAKRSLEPLTNKKIEINPDPVFFLTAEEWCAYEQPYPVKGKYILVYAIHWDKKLNVSLRRLHRQTGLPIIAIKNVPSTVYCNKACCDVGPAEFLWLIDHAEYVVSSSFHGIAFSAVFHKKFSAVINPIAPSRINCLLNIFDLPEVKIDELTTCDAFNYGEVELKFSQERERSMDYLRNSLL